MQAAQVQRMRADAVRLERLGACGVWLEGVAVSRGDLGAGGYVARGEEEH